MERDKELILLIKKIREANNIDTMSFLKLLIKLNPMKGKRILDKIQKGDKKVQELSELLHMKNKRTDIDILNEIEKVREKNNKVWMDVVRMCFELDPKKARKIFFKIKEYDKEIQALTKEISSNKNK